MTPEIKWQFSKPIRIPQTQGSPILYSWLNELPPPGARLPREAQWLKDRGSFIFDALSESNTKVDGL
jgi:hypothetical protein